MAARKTDAPDQSTAEGGAAALVPLAQRQVQIEGEQVLAVWTGQQDIYVPLRPLCEALGVQLNGQLARIRRDEVLAEGLRRIRVETDGGPQLMQALHLEGVPLWLAGVEPSRVREEVRPRLRLFKRWVRQRIWEAFARETGIAGAVEEARAPVPEAPEVRTLEHIEQMALAIATMARQQRAFEQQVDQRLAALDTHVAALADGQETMGGRLDQAAAVVGGLLRRVDSLEHLVAPGQVISEAQAAEISALVKAVAAAITEQDRRAGAGGRNPYQAVFGELYRRFRVSSYHNIPARRFAEVMAWLRDYQGGLDESGEDGVP